MIYGEKQLGNTSFAIQIKQPEINPNDGDGLEEKQKENLNYLLNYMQIHQEMNSKKGSKVTPYKDDIKWTDLASMLHQNSHDFSEIKLNSSEIYFSGSEDSPEKMTIVSTKFSLEYNYDSLYRDAYKNCMANSTCGVEVPSKLKLANDMAL